MLRFLTAVLILFFSVLPSTVYAQNVTVDDSEYAVTQNPATITPSTDQISFTITSKSGNWSQIPAFSYEAVDVNKGSACGQNSMLFNSRFGSGYPTGTAGGDQNKLVIKVPLNKPCLKTPGDYSFALWKGNQPEPSSHGDLIVINYPFSIPQPAGGSTSLGPGPAGVLQLQEMIQRITNLIVPISFIAVTIMLIVAGIKFLTSGGETKPIQAAGQTVTWALLGLLFLILAWLILMLIQAVTGSTIDITKFCIGFPGAPTNCSNPAP